MNTRSAYALGMSAMDAADGVAFPPAPQHVLPQPPAACAIAKRNSVVDALGVDATAVRAGAGRTVDTRGTRAWSPPV